MVSFLEPESGDSSSSADRDIAAAHRKRPEHAVVATNDHDGGSGSRKRARPSGFHRSPSGRPFTPGSPSSSHTITPPTIKAAEPLLPTTARNPILLASSSDEESDSGQTRDQIPAFPRGPASPPSRGPLEEGVLSSGPATPSGGRPGNQRSWIDLAALSDSESEDSLLGMRSGLSHDRKPAPQRTESQPPPWSGTVADTNKAPKHELPEPSVSARIPKVSLEGTENVVDLVSLLDSDSESEDKKPPLRCSSALAVDPVGSLASSAAADTKPKATGAKWWKREPKKPFAAGNTGVSGEDQKPWFQTATIPPLPEKTRLERLHHLGGIEAGADKALQLLLWEIGFSYNVYAHQFEAIRFVAGLVPAFPVVSGTRNSTNVSDDSPEGARLRSEALTMAAAECGSCHHTEEKRVHTLPTKGMLLADEMGLGKTVEALAGAALRTAMLSCDPDRRNVPTLIVSPQDGIQNQWYETLVRSGVPPASIVVWGESRTKMTKRQGVHLQDTVARSRGDYIGSAAGVGPVHPGGHDGCTQSYILCTRYNIQSELRNLFRQMADLNTAKGGDRRRIEEALMKDKASTLFRNISLPLIRKLQNQYLADKGKEKNRFILEKEKREDCVARLVRNASPRSNQRRATSGSASAPEFTFQTIIVDEAHFCKNVLAYWGLGLALLGSHSRRAVLLTGTPYNNGPSDMSALMTYIDPAHKAASVTWWDRAVSSSDNGTGSKRGAADAVSEWRKAYLLRRTKEVLQQKLPPRIKDEIDVGAIPSELWVYEAYEGKFLSALSRLRRNLETASPEARFKAKKAFEVMIACMACMRMSLVHPMLPGEREMTIQFSPSRKHLLKREERPDKCVFCISDPTKTAKEHKAKKEKNRDGDGKASLKRNYENEDEDNDLLALAGATRTDMDLDDDELDDDDFDGDFEAKSKKERELEERKKGPIVPLGPEFCSASESGCRHFAHKKCIEACCEVAGASCPRCLDLKSRLHGKFPGNTYCGNIATHIDDPGIGGFIASAKIERAIQWFQSTVPQNEKAIFLSFFKGTLDLIEGILVSKFGINCARYDGDVSKEDRTVDLERFKTTSTCRALLATVQSGGTGLNITEANHICFLDRWFNPCVHDQAESRCHRIGQKKIVSIAYLDMNYTIDNVMKRINILKEGNASIILADGTSLGDRWSLGYKSVSGVIGETMNALRDMREQIIKVRGDEPLPPYEETDLEQKLVQMKGTVDMKGKQEHKVEPEATVLPVASLASNFIDLCDSEDSDENTDEREKTYSDGRMKPQNEWRRGFQSSMSTKSASFNLAARQTVPGLLNQAMAYFDSQKVLLHTKSLKQLSHTADNSQIRRTPVAQNSTQILHASAHSHLKPKKRMTTSLAGQKRPASVGLFRPSAKVSRGIAAIISQQRKNKDVMRRKKRGELGGDL